MNEDTPRKMEEVWVKNAHGVKSAWPRHVAEKMVRKNYGWSFTDPDEVPKQKQYPLGMGEFTESGLKRRLSARESQEIANARPAEEKKEEADQQSIDDLRTQAKRLGIKNYWSKSRLRLVKEITES